MDADLPKDEAPPCLDEARETVSRTTCGKADGVCNISVELLKVKGEALTRSLYAVFNAVWEPGTISRQGKKGLVVPIWKWKENHQHGCSYHGNTILSMPGEFFSHQLLMRIWNFLMKL